MVGNHPPGFDQLDGFQGVVGTHREVVADWQDGQVDAILPDQLHVVEQAGVGGVVDRAVCQLQQDPTGIAAVGAVGQHGAVVSDRQLDGSPIEDVLAADVLGVRGGHSLPGQPLDDLVIGNHQGPGSVGHADRVPDVVTVSVTENNHIGRHLFGGHRG